MRIYKKNGLDRFWVPPYRRRRVWLLATTCISTALYFLHTYIQHSIIQNLLYISISITVTIFISALLKLYRDLKQIGSLKYYIKSKMLSRAIKSNFIDTMHLNKALLTSRIKVPDVFVNFAKYDNHKTIKVTVERMAGVDDVDSVSNLVSNAFKGKMEDYATSFYIENSNKRDYVFFLENVNLNRRLVPKSFKDLTGELDLYTYNLQKGVTWELSHALVSGRTKSGKSTFLYSLIGQMLEKNLHDNIYIIDPKNEFSILKAKGIINNIAVKSDEALELVSEVINKMEERSKELLKVVEEKGKFGDTARHHGYKPIILIVDEASSLLASFPDKKSKDKYLNDLMRIVQMGRSASIFQIQSLQVASTEFLPSSVRNQLNLRVLLGDSPTTVDLQFMFNSDYKNLVKNKEQYTGYYFQDGMEQPQKFFNPDLHTYDLMDIEKLKKGE